MPWVKVDDDFFDHIKIVRAGRDARDLYLAALLYASKSLSDGFVPSDILDYLAGKAGVGDPADLAHRLVDVNLWEEAECGWLIHDYHDYNPAAEKVKADRNAARERMAKVRENGHAPKPDAPPLYRSRSDAVHANNGRTTSEVPPTPYPVPGPGDTSDSAESSAALPRSPGVSFAEFSARLRGAPANKAAAILAEAFAIWFQRDCQEFSRLAALAKHPGAGQVLKAMHDLIPRWNGIDNPLDYITVTLQPRGGVGRAVDRSEMAGTTDYVALYDAKQARERGKGVSGHPEAP